MLCLLNVYISNNWHFALCFLVLALLAISFFSHPVALAHFFHLHPFILFLTLIILYLSWVGSLLPSKGSSFFIYTYTRGDLIWNVTLIFCFKVFMNSFEICWDKFSSHLANGNGIFITGVMPDLHWFKWTKVCLVALFTWDSSKKNDSYLLYTAITVGDLKHYNLEAIFI